MLLKMIFCLRAILSIDWSWIPCCSWRHRFGIYYCFWIYGFLAGGLFFMEPHWFVSEVPLIFRRAIVRWPFFCCLFDTEKKEDMNDNMSILSLALSIWTIKSISLIHITKSKNYCQELNFFLPWLMKTLKPKWMG